MVDLIGLVRTAAAEGRLRVVYQPVVRLGDGCPVGVEALLRMVDRQGSTVMPDVFVPVAEDCGAIGELGAWILAEACEQAARWKERLPAGSDFAVGVNLSPRQLSDPGLLDRFDQARGRLAPSAVVLELTEGLPPPTDRLGRQLLDGLIASGYHLGLDDFGTGHASLKTLRAYAFDCVKLDRSWTARLVRTDPAGDLARSLAGLALRSGCKVIVEGVETLDERDAAGLLGCTMGQGYLWSRPVPAEELTRWLTVHGGLSAQPGSVVEPSPWDSRVSGSA